MRWVLVLRKRNRRRRNRPRRNRRRRNRRETNGVRITWVIV